MNKHLLLWVVWASLSAAGGGAIYGDKGVQLHVAITGASSRSAVGHHTQGAPSQQSINILAIRVSFQSDDLATTTGDGSLDLSTSSNESINPPPHNRTYFRAQLAALAHYYSSVSGGKLTLSYEIYPEAEEASYQLPRDMKYYSGEGDESLTSQRWGELLADALQGADGDSIDFSRFDSYFIFHAGVGADFKFDFDPTPYDIQSVFIDFETLRSTIGAHAPDYPGISVQGGSYFIREGVILPETESQEGYEIGLLGTMTLLFGAQLGLPSLMDTEGQRPGIGRWGLMDQGSANLQGLVPAQPCAWSKVYLGWEEPITTSGVVQVAAALAHNPRQIYKIPINSQEYFLIENRQRDINRDGRIIGYDAQGSRVEILEDGRLLPTGWSGTIVRLDEYDFGLPGSGILIWHINEQVIREHIASNTVNADIDNRGVRLVECDAAQDIGHYYGWPLFGYDAGDYWDPWWQGNESHLEANASDRVAFTPNTLPNSNSASGAGTRISLTDFSDLDSVMTVKISADLFQSGFPQYINARCGQNSVSVATILARGDSVWRPAIVAASVSGEVFAWYADGGKVIDNSDSAAVIGINGDTTRYPLALFATVGDSVERSPLIADITGDGIPEIVVAGKGGALYIWGISDDDGDGRGDLLQTASLPAAISSEIVAGAAARIYAGLETGEVVALEWGGGELSTAWQSDICSGAVVGLALATAELLATGEEGTVARLRSMDGDIRWSLVTGISGDFNQPVVADFDGDGELEVVVVLSDGTVRGFDLGGSEITTPYAHSFGMVATHPAAGDVDGDGLPEVIFADRSGIRAFDCSGVISSNFSIDFAREVAAEVPLSSPLVGDLDDDGVHDILFDTPGGFLSIIKPAQGDEAELHFPLDGVTGTPALYDVDEDGDAEIIALMDDGSLHVLNTFAPYTAFTETFPWPQQRGGAAHTAALTTAAQHKAGSGNIFVNRSVYCYPNPTEGNTAYIRYQLNEEVDELEVEIFDMIGERIATMEGTGFVHSDNEVSWSLSGIASGIYLARVAARSGSRSAHVFIKIAVVK